MADRSVKYVFRGDFSGLTAGLAAAGRNVQEFGGKLTALDKDGAKMRAGLTQIGGTAGRMGLAAGAGLAFVTKAAMDWETAWTGVLKTVDGSPAQLAKLEAGLRNLATETGFAHDEVAAVAEAAGQLGISTDGIEDFTRTMLDMGVSTSMSSEEAATGLARLRNIMGSTEAEIGNTGAAMVELGNNFATTEGEILAMSLRLAGAGRQAGLTTPDVLGLAASMSSVGIEAEAGGTAMSLTMKRIGKEVETGGDKLSLFAETAGMSTEEFARAWEQDAAGALTAFVAGLGNAEAMGMSTNAVLRELGVTGIREADALLRLSGNAEQLAEALGMSGEGFAENAALAEEAGKFYATSGQQAKQAWADIKDAAIDAGAVVLPIASKIAQGVGGIATEFGDLPGPIQATTTGLLGLTAITGGGLWFGSKVVTGIADTKQALSDLGIQAGKTRGALAGIGKGIQFIALIQGVNMLDDALASLFDQRLDDSNLGRNLESLAGGRTVENLGKIANWLDVLNRSGEEWQEKFFGKLPGETAWGEARNQIEKIDEVLAQWVEAGRADDAAAAFEEIQAQVKAAGGNTEESAKWFGEYGKALDNAGDAATGAADATDDLSTAQGQAKKRADDFAKAQEKTAEALAASRKAAREQASAWLTLGDSLDDAKASLSDWLKEMEQQAQALNQFADNAEKAANRGLRKGLIDALAEAGPAGAMRMKQLANATDAEIKRANRSWRDGQKAIEHYTDVLGGVPDSVATDLELRDDDAKRKIREIMAQLANIPREIRTSYYVTQMQRVVKPELMKPSADGGPVPKTGLGYADRHPYLLADGEFVVSNRTGQVDRNIELLWAINAGRLAAGGRAGGGVASTTSATLDDRIAIVGLLQQIRDLRRDLRATGKNRLTGWDREAAQLDLERAHIELRAAMNREQREAKAAAREQARADREARAELRGSRSSLFDSLFPAEEQTMAQQVSGIIKDFRAQWEAAGGTWTAALREWAKDAREAAAEYDRTTTALDAEMTRRDELTATLSEQQSALESLTSTMDAFGDTVAGRFLSNAFGGARTDRVAGEAGQATADLEAARAELAAVRASATGDSMAEVARAAELIARIRDLEAASAAELADREVEVTGLEALRETLLTDRANADRMAAALTTLAGKGLDTDGLYGGLYKDLAASGDFATAEQLAALTREQIDEYEKLFAAREDSAAAVGALATQAVYGAQQAAMQAQIEAQNQLIMESTAAIELLTATQTVLAEQVRSGAESGAMAGATKTVTAVDRVNASVIALPAQIAEQKKKAKL